MCTILAIDGPRGCSSSGAIAVTAGFAPMAIGTETEGCLVSPATRQSLETVRASVSIIPDEVIMSINRWLNVLGPLCATVKDTTDLFTVLVVDGKSDAISIKNATVQGYKRLETLAADYHHHVNLGPESDFEYEGANALFDLLGILLRFTIVNQVLPA
ncbi:hypothetical protein O1611_g9442 [Lasiodiplodia mahajangana]|uniref:Uncharacterized protein n=1 Tax=Lasiodiplodia mahajangana TaxID=1108764 RepID=A0ACC2J9B3_9PEZI|nr:hypothetical protein O1611_g9442 [Lasiodiplodia mahajangana]